MYYNDDPDLIGGKLSMWIDTALYDIGTKDIEIDYSRFISLIEKMSRVNEPDGFPHEDGFEAASVYKKAAYFFNLFTALKPVRSISPLNVIPEKIWDNNLEQHDWVNTYMAYLMVKVGLHGAGYMNSLEQPVTLENPIHVSLHTLQDMIEAYADVTAVDKFQLTTLLIEQMCYKVNPLAEYLDKV